MGVNGRIMGRNTHFSQSHFPHFHRVTNGKMGNVPTLRQSPPPRPVRMIGEGLQRPQAGHTRRRVISSFSCCSRSFADFSHVRRASNSASRTATSSMIRASVSAFRFSICCRSRWICCSCASRSAISAADTVTERGSRQPQMALDLEGHGHLHVIPPHCPNTGLSKQGDPVFPHFSPSQLFGNHQF